MKPGADCREQEAAREAQCRGEHGAARAAFFNPAAEDGGRKTEENDGDREGSPGLKLCPIVRGGLITADEMRKRNDKGREGVGLSDAQMDAQGCRRHKKAVVVRRCDRICLVEE